MRERESDRDVQLTSCGSSSEQLKRKRKEKHLLTPLKTFRCTAGFILQVLHSSQFWHEVRVLSMSVKSVRCIGRLLISMLRYSEVWATTILLNFDALVFSCCFSESSFGFFFSKEVWSKYDLTDHLTKLIMFGLRGETNQKVLEKCMETYQGIKSVHRFPLCIYLELWSADRMGGRTLTF